MENTDKPFLVAPYDILDRQIVTALSKAAAVVIHVPYAFGGKASFGLAKFLAMRPLAERISFIMELASQAAEAEEKLSSELRYRDIVNLATRRAEDLAKLAQDLLWKEREKRDRLLKEMARLKEHLFLITLMKESFEALGLPSATAKALRKAGFSDMQDVLMLADAQFDQTKKLSEKHKEVVRAYIKDCRTKRGLPT